MADNVAVVLLPYHLLDVRLGGGAVRIGEGALNHTG
jgi:hypothetical protein